MNKSLSVNWLKQNSRRILPCCLAAGLSVVMFNSCHASGAGTWTRTSAFGIVFDSVKERKY
jgi:hypothetical protein